MAQKIPETCPKCDHPLTVDTISALYRCKHCGHTIPKPEESLEAAMARIRAKGTRPPVTLTTRGPVETRARSAFESGHDALWRENTAEALRSFQRAADFQPDFADAHLWIAKISDDPAVQRDHLESILAYDPGHSEALRLLMVMDGRLTPEQAAHADQDAAPEIRTTETPVGAATTPLLCPVCGGHLTVDEQNGRVKCRFCGHAGPLPARDDARADTLGVALLERKAQPVKWVIGERLLHCTQCSAERTIPAVKLSAV
ncbi:MAG: hypothetical protein GYB67_19505 [Chloroflexi bacterium]|nr:hypothetical protein [Chloroflexota bacterium]